MFRRLLSKTTNKKMLFSIPAAAFVTSVFEELDDKRDLEITRKELEETNLAIDFLNNDLKNFNKKSDVFNHLKETNQELAFKTVYNLIENNKKPEDTIKKEDIEHAISSLEDEKLRKENRISRKGNYFFPEFSVGDYDFSFKIENVYCRIFANFLLYALAAKPCSREINGFIIKGVNPFKSIKNFTHFPFGSSIIFALCSTKIVLNILSLTNSVLYEYIKKLNRDDSKQLVLENLKKYSSD